jgi:hypothetical protein
MTEVSPPTDGSAGRRSWSLQTRRGGSDEQITDATVLRELSRVEDPEEAERLERILGDVDIIRRLQLQDFDPNSKDWRQLTDTLARYGYGVFVGWAHTGILRRMAANHGRSGVLGYTKLPEGLRLVGDDAHELATELIIVSIEAFRTKTLMHPNPSKRWRPEGGASLRTFFVGRCLMELPDVYEAWIRKNKPNGELLTDEPLKWERVFLDGPEEKAVASVEVEALHAYHDSTTLLMFQLQADGYSYVEIVEMLWDAGIEVTEGSVRSRLTRLRSKLGRETGEQWEHKKGNR